MILINNTNLIALSTNRWLKCNLIDSVRMYNIILHERYKKALLLGYDRHKYYIIEQNPIIDIYLSVVITIIDQ